MSPCVEARRARPLLGTFVEIAARASDEAVLQRAVAVGFIAVAQVHGMMKETQVLLDLCMAGVVPINKAGTGLFAEKQMVIRFKRLSYRQNSMLYIF